MLDHMTLPTRDTAVIIEPFVNDRDKGNKCGIVLRINVRQIIHGPIILIVILFYSVKATRSDARDLAKAFVFGFRIDA